MPATLNTAETTRFGPYLVKYDAKGREWDVTHDEHGLMDSFTFRVDAIAYARDEHEGDRLAGLRDEVAGLAADCEKVEVLERVRAILAGN